MRCLVNFLPKCFSVMVEVGSRFGISTLIFAERFGKVYCVDPWEYALPRNREYEEFVKNTRHKNNIIPIRKRSLDGVKDFADNSLDFVYIDGLHDFENVKSDIEAWYQKVRIGGILGGHDYTHKRGGQEVIKAVDTFFWRPDKTFPDSSWLVKKEMNS